MLAEHADKDSGRRVVCYRRWQDHGTGATFKHSGLFGAGNDTVAGSRPPLARCEPRGRRLFGVLPSRAATTGVLLTPL